MLNKIPKLIKLEKPLVVFDLETTGLSINLDRIVEIAYLKIMPNGVVFKSDILLNPEMNIPEEAIEVHGITNEDVKDKPTFKRVAQDLWGVFCDCSYGGFNILTFDLPILRREFLRVGLDFDFTQAKIIDSKTVYHAMEPRTLSAAYKFYCGKEHTEAHSALADVEVTAEILKQQLKQYKQISDWDFIYKLHHEPNNRYVDNERKFYWRDGQAYFSFSKYRDRALSEIAEKDRGFLEWIISADFSEETKNIIKKALGGEMPKKAA